MNDTMELHDFLDMCREIVITKGEDCPSRIMGNMTTQVCSGPNINAYVDENIGIFMSRDNAETEIIVGEEAHPDNLQNPAIMINKDYEIFRQHGEWRYLIPVVEKLLSS